MIRNSAVCLLEEAWARNPRGEALSDGIGSISYSQLRTSARRAGTGILRLAAGPGPVLVLLPKGIAMVTCMFAALYSGRAYVPSDSASPLNRLATIVGNLRPSLIITDEGHCADLSFAGNTPVVTAEALLASQAEEAALDAALAAVTDEDPAYIMYTSGSTGTPKGVTIPHRGILNFALWAKDTFSWDKRTVIANQAPLYFDVSVMDVYGALACGGKLILTPEALFRFPAKLPEFLRDNGVTSIYWVPTVMMRVAESGALEEYELPRLKSVAFAGEVMPNGTLNRWRRALPGRVFANLYGPTETDVCTAYLVDRPFDDADPLPIGRPIRNMRVLLLDETGQPGTQGEIVTAGSGITLGYWNDPVRTADSFVEVELGGRKRRFYRTGDLGSLNERGEIMFHGRRDGQIKLGGNRIELGEVENAARLVPGVKNVCAMLDARKKEIVLFAEAEEDIPLRVFQRSMRKLLPGYMIPARAVLLPELPHNANDKIDRALLKRRLEEEND